VNNGRRQCSKIRHFRSHLLLEAVRTQATIRDSHHACALLISTSMRGICFERVKDDREMSESDARSRVKDSTEPVEEAGREEIICLTALSPRAAPRELRMTRAPAGGYQTGSRLATKANVASCDNDDPVVEGVESWVELRRTIDDSLGHCDDGYGSRRRNRG